MQIVRLKPGLNIKNLFTGIRGTLLAAFVLLSIGAVGLVAIISVWLGTGIAQDLVFDELVAETELSEQAINNWLDERQHDLAIIVNNTSDVEQARLALTAQNTSASLQSLLLKRLQVETGPTSSFKEIFLVNSQGKIVLSTEESSVGQNQQSQLYFQNGMLAPFISSPFFNSADGKSEIIITVPVRDELGSILGVLVARLDLSQVTEIILVQSGFTSASEIYLVSTDYRFITQPRFESLATSAARSLGIDQVLTPGPNRNGQDFYENYNGVKVAGVYRWLPDLEAALLAERVEDEALSGVRQLILFSSGIAVLVLLIATAVALYVTSRITRPISALTELAIAIAKGDLNRTITIEAHNEIGFLAQAFNTMTENLRDLIERLQQRTRALETSAEISRGITTLLNVDDLLQDVVNRIQKEFDFYHVHIYFIEKGSGNLIMAEGSGEVGQQLKEKGHYLLSGRGIVGTVASTGKHVLSNNVKESSNFVPNVLLPLTASELGVPLRKGEQILGVLDIQSKQINRFTFEDVLLMQSIADQVAVGIDNARLFQETQATVGQVEALNRRLTHEVWHDVDSRAHTTGYTFTKTGLASTPTEWIPTMTEAVYQKQLVHQVSNSNPTESITSLAVPLSLRGEMIGVIGIERQVDKSWSEDELIAIQTITEQVALALDTARLVRETERSAWRDQMVSESTAKVWSSAEIEEVMRAAVAQLGDKLRASEVVIRLGTEAELVEE